MLDPPRTQSNQKISKKNPSQNNYENITNLGRLQHSEEYQGVVQLRPNSNYSNNQESMESDDSGVCSPPLWKNSPSPSRSPSQPLLSHHHHQNYRSLSPNSRTQAIARGQWELMEMVKNMPESSYELSLKDLVEHQFPKIETPQPPPPHQVKRQESKKFDQNKNVKRSGYFENKGLFLNMVFPFSFNSKKKKKKNFACNSNGKVSPKPEVVVKGGGGGGGERDWWKKKFTGSSDSDSSRTSVNSGSSGSAASSGGSTSSGSYTGNRKRSGFFTGCWPFLQSRKKESVE